MRTKITLTVFFSLVIAGIAYGQLQQSGGPGSVVTFGSPQHVINDANTAVIGHVINDTGSTTAVTGNVTVVQGTGSNLHVAVDSAPTTAVTGTFFQGTQPISGTVSTVPKTACGTTVFSQALVAVPTSATAVAAATTCVMVIVLNNTTAGALTVTVSDNAGTPINDVLTFSVPAFSQLIQPLWGVQFTSGIKWAASGSNVTGAVLGYQ